MSDLNEKLKLVAKYDGYEVLETGTVTLGQLKKNQTIIPLCDYDSDYQRQIPVWQKVFSELMIFRTSLDKNSFNQKVEGIDLITFNYKVAIFKGTPLESFEILVQAIQFINNLKQN